MLGGDRLADSIEDRFQISLLAAFYLLDDDQLFSAAYLDRKTAQIDTLIMTENESIILLQEIRTSLISEVVTGKIDVRDEVTA